MTALRIVQNIDPDAFPDADIGKMTRIAAGITAAQIRKAATDVANFQRLADGHSAAGNHYIAAKLQDRADSARLLHQKLWADLYPHVEGLGAQFTA